MGKHNSNRVALIVTTYHTEGRKLIKFQKRVMDRQPADIN